MHIFDRLWIKRCYAFSFTTKTKTATTTTTKRINSCQQNVLLLICSLSLCLCEAHESFSCFKLSLFRYAQPHTYTRIQLVVGRILLLNFHRRRCRRRHHHHLLLRVHRWILFFANILNEQMSRHIECGM